MKKFRKIIQRAAVVLMTAAMVFTAVPAAAFADDAAETETETTIAAEETAERGVTSDEDSDEDATITALDTIIDGTPEAVEEETAEDQTDVLPQDEEKIEAAEATEGRPSETEKEADAEETEKETGTEEETTETVQEDEVASAEIMTFMASPVKAAPSGDIVVTAYSGYGNSDVIYYTNSFSSTYGNYWPAYCIDHDHKAPQGQTYAPSTSQSNALGYVMAHGYPNETWGLNWAEAQYLTQAAVYGIMGGHSAMYEISGGVHSPAYIWAAVFGGSYEEGSWSVNGNFQRAEALYQAAVNNATSADAPYALFYTPYNSVYQRMVIPVPVPKTENVTVRKITSDTDCSSQLAGNGMYSQDFGGAQFTVTVDGESWGTYTTGSDGTFTVEDVPIDSYVSVRETIAPAGYLLNPNEAGVTATKGGANTIIITDEPTFDSRRVSVYKVAYINNEMTKTYVEGAVFKMEYFDNEEFSGTPTRTWYFETKENGRFYYASDWLAEGYNSDALYKTPGGDEDLPIGSFRITEVYSPEGFMISGTVLEGTVYQPSNGEQAVSSWVNTPSGNITVEEDGTIAFGNTPKYGAITIEKFDSDLKETASGDATFDGVKVQVINASGDAVTLADGTEVDDGAVVAALTFTEGSHSVCTGNILPVGTYTIREIASNEWYELNADWRETATLTDDWSDILATAYASGSSQAELDDVPFRATISLCKIDKENGKAEAQGEGSLENAEISIYNISANPVKVNDSVYEPYAGETAEWIRENGEPCCIVYTDTEGRAETPALPGGTYLALETAASEGYLINMEWAPVITIDSTALEAGNIMCDTPLEEQITYHPAIGTVAKASDGGDVIELSKTAVINDAVKYSGLTPGHEYILRATVYDKTSGKNLEGVAVEAKFTAKDSDGTAAVKIQLDTTGIAGHCLVVFEKLYVIRNGEEKQLAEHEDVDDTDQAVTVDRPHEDHPHTGDNSRLWIWMSVLGAAGAGLITAYIVLIKKTKNEKDKAE